MTEESIPAVRQKLMSAEEVFLYKVPNLKTSGGHRAEDWNLAEPIKTASLLAEQEGDTLILKFLHEGDKVFAQAQVDIAAGQKVAHWLEQAVDSSRYFVVKIQGAGGREALVGFGFRDRDEATDLRECLQHYENSIQRDKEALARSSLSASFSIPKLAEGEKIHANLSSSGKSSISKKDKKPSTGGGAIPLLKKPPAGSIPLLKKPPPPSSTTTALPETEVPDRSLGGSMQELSISVGEIDLDAAGENGSEDGSGGAVFEGDEDQWATEFELK